MATLLSLKSALRTEDAGQTDIRFDTLSDAQYEAGFRTLREAAANTSYQQFIYPQLKMVVERLAQSSTSISILEVGPGPESVLGSLPVQLRMKIHGYKSFEPNASYTTTLRQWIKTPLSDGKTPFPMAQDSIDILNQHFDCSESNSSCLETKNAKYDLVLFCHSMYGMRPQLRYINSALKLLPDAPQNGVVVVFHRRGGLDLEGLVSQRSAVFNHAHIVIPDDDMTLDCFASFISGSAPYTMGSECVAIQARRRICRQLGQVDESGAARLQFLTPELMVIFDRKALTATELSTSLPSTANPRKIKNYHAGRYSPALIVTPQSLAEVQKCVRWALTHSHKLTVIGGSHSGHCQWPNVVAINMDAFASTDFVKSNGFPSSIQTPSLENLEDVMVVGAGCRAGNIVRAAAVHGRIIPLGARPGVGIGLWLQGGIGHLARPYGLTCDAIIGAVFISVADGTISCVGTVPAAHRPPFAKTPELEDEILWGIKGAGTNLGIVTSVVFKTYIAPKYMVRDWLQPTNDVREFNQGLRQFNDVAKKLPDHCSIDAYLYWDAGRLCWGATMFECSFSSDFRHPEQITQLAENLLGPSSNARCLNSEEMFDADLYMSGMHGSHIGSTSSFKRCVFLKNIGMESAQKAIQLILTSQPTGLCYLHLLQGGGAIVKIAETASAVGCRDWDFACVITGVWEKQTNDPSIEAAVERWVYSAVGILTPYASGVYSADLGPDPRDAPLADKAFGANHARLAALKRMADPYDVLAYACPIPAISTRLKILFLVTGDSCAGKDYCAEQWSRIFMSAGYQAKVASISDLTKREYSVSVGADFNALRADRQYKELHRPALSDFFAKQLQINPHLLETHLSTIVCENYSHDILLVTGLREATPASIYCHLFPKIRLVEVRVSAPTGLRSLRQASSTERVHWRTASEPEDIVQIRAGACLHFDNSRHGFEAMNNFAVRYLLPLCHKDHERLSEMVPDIINFPCPGSDFRHVLNVAQVPEGLSICTRLMKTCFMGIWGKVDRIVCCEAGGFILAAPLALDVNIPMALIRPAGKLPPPTVSVRKDVSHISSLGIESFYTGDIEISSGLLKPDSSVVVIDDVLASGRTLFAVLSLLMKAGLPAENIAVMVLAEFPLHRGRRFLCDQGFGGVGIQSLLTFDGK